MAWRNSRLLGTGRRLYRSLVAHPDVVERPVETCTGLLAFRFTHGWHPLVETFRQFEVDPGLEAQRSAVFRFHAAFACQGAYDFVRWYDDRVAFRPPFGIFPWGAFRLDSGQPGGRPKDPLTSRFCGPSTPTFAEAEYHRSIELYRRLRDEGYRPWHHGFIGGTLLRRADGTERFVVLQGNHRLAALAALGAERVLTSYSKRHHRLIDERTAADWHYVRTGECSVRDALAYFHAYFELDGRAQAAGAGLIAS